jgi:hypothetical protein
MDEKERKMIAVVAVVFVLGKMITERSSRWQVIYQWNTS